MKNFIKGLIMFLGLVALGVIVSITIGNFKHTLDNGIPYEICHGFNCPEHDSIIHRKH